MIKANMNNTQKKSKFKSETIKKFVEIYKSNDLKIEQNETEIEKLKKRLGDKECQV